MTPAETLREAARLMRRDAETAKILRADDPYYQPQVLPDGSVLSEQPTFERRWHPAVALAVADWLDVSAWSLDNGLQVDAQSVTVARAYLGES